MKNLFLFMALCGVILTGCMEKKEAETKTSEIKTLEGMWKLRSCIWDNEDGTFLRYPEDSITQGNAYIIYSKTHYMLIAEAPNMDYYRGELIEYAIDSNRLTVTTRISNFDQHVGMKAVWTFSIENDVLTAENGKNKEVWERVE